MNPLMYILEDPGRAEELEREKQWREGDLKGKHSKIKYHLLKGSSKVPHVTVLNTAGAHMIKGMGKKQGRATGKKGKMRGVRVPWGNQGTGQEQGRLWIIIR